MAKLVKVEMMIDTAYRGPRKQGEVVSVPVDFAARWAKNKIAKIIKEEVKEAVAEEAAVARTIYEMRAKELFDLCVQKNLAVEPKQSKEYYINQLESIQEG